MQQPTIEQPNPMPPKPNITPVGNGKRVFIATLLLVTIFVGIIFILAGILLLR